MTSSANPGGPAQSHRFVLVYRSETREIEGAATIWRGWVQRVPNPRQREMDMQTDDRVDFRDLAEVPELLELLMTLGGHAGRGQTQHQEAQTMMTTNQIVRPATPSLYPGGQRQVSSGPPAVRIAASRPEIDRREPALSFQVTATEARFFDVVVATDPMLFRAEEAHRRTAKNFRISRQDFEDRPIEIETGFYMLPRAFLRDVVSVEPKPSRLYYIAIGYSDSEGGAPVFSTPLDALESAPHVILSPSLTAESLARVLGMAVEQIGAVNGQGRVVPPRREPSQVAAPRMIGGLPLPSREPGRSAEAPRPRYKSPPQWNATPPQPRPHPQPQPAPAAQPEPRAHQGARAEPSAPAPRPAEGANGTARQPAPPQAMPRPDAPAAPAPEASGAAQPAAGAETGGFVDDDMSYGLPGQPAPQVPGFRDLDHGAAHAPAAYDDGFGAMSFEAAGAAAPEGGNGPAIPPMDPAPEAPPAPLQQAAPAPQPAAQPGSPPNGPPRDVSEADALVQLVIGRGAGNRYEALNLDGAYRGRAGTDHPYYQKAHEGLRFGPHQVSQDSGELGELLGLMQSADPASFERIFGAASAQLLEMTNAPGPTSLEVPGGRSARVQPLEGKDLWEDPWASRFREAAQHAPFQAAMRAHIIARRLEPVMPMAEAVGLDDAQGRAMLLSLAIHYGPQGAEAALRQAVNPFDSPARTAAALEAVGAASLTVFQQQNGLAVSETMTAETHFALIRALRALGPESPVQLPDREAAKDMLVTAVPPGAAGDALLKLRTDEALGQPGAPAAPAQGGEM